MYGAWGIIIIQYMHENTCTLQIELYQLFTLGAYATSTDRLDLSKVADDDIIVLGGGHWQYSFFLRSIIMRDK